MASASNPVPPEDGPKLVTEKQYKDQMAFYEGKIAGVVQKWRSTAPGEEKEIRRLWRKLHKWVTDAGEAAGIADANGWDVDMPSLVISSMEELAAPADLDLYRRFARIKPNDPRIASNEWFTGSQEPATPGREPSPVAGALRPIPTAPRPHTAVAFALPQHQADEMETSANPSKLTTHGAVGPKNTKTSASMKGKGKERAITIDSDADDDREPQQVVPKAKKAPSSKPKPKKRAVSVPEVEEDDQPEPGVPKKRTTAASNAKGKERAVRIPEEEQDDEPEQAVPKKTTAAASKGKGKQRAESVVADDQDDRVPHKSVPVRPILKKAVSEIPSESEPDVTPGMDLENRIEEAIEVDDYRTLVKICKAERARLNLGEFNWAGSHNKRRENWIRLMDTKCQRCHSMHCWISSDPRRDVTTCDECFRKHRPCVPFDAEVPVDPESGRSRSRSRTPSAAKANPRKRARSASVASVATVPPDTDPDGGADSDTASVASTSSRRSTRITRRPSKRPRIVSEPAKRTRGRSQSKRRDATVELQVVETPRGTTPSDVAGPSGRGPQVQRPRAVPAYIGLPPSRLASLPSVQEGERFVSLESSSAISRELHTLRRENVELRDKYDQLRRDFQDLCAHLGVEGRFNHDNVPDGAGGPLPRLVPMHPPMIDNDVDMDQDRVAPAAITLSGQADKAQAEGVDIGAGNEIKAGERSENYPPLFDDDVNMDDDPVVPSTGVISGQPETAQAEGFDVGSAELPKMSEGSGGSHSGSVTPHSETATSPRPVPESPDVSGASAKSPGMADDECGQSQLPGQAQQAPGPAAQPSEAPPPLPVALGEISGDTPNSDREEEGGAGAYTERNVNDSQRTVPESTQESIPATPDASDDTSHSHDVKAPGACAISAEASDAATLKDATVPTATSADPAHIDHPPESDPAHFDHPSESKEAMEANGVIYIYGTQIANKVKQSKDPRYQDADLIRKMWKAVQSLTFNIADMLRSATEKNWLVYVPPIAISAMEELASNASDDCKTRMARIKADDPRVFKNSWYSASAPPGMSHLFPIADAATAPGSSQLSAIPRMPQNASRTVADHCTQQHRLRPGMQFPSSSLTSVVLLWTKMDPPSLVSPESSAHTTKHGGCVGYAPLGVPQGIGRRGGQCRYGPRAGHASDQGIELFETAADVSCELYELRQENAKLHVMHDQLREDFAALRQRLLADTKATDSTKMSHNSD
ncbi:uncharacterized protein B0H18DRAFT_1125731 [Fomitopsis serialis]|uniref:uncharacterized protein n=1 Tax=Fomitopsis serialis TaxID=139415 RepID=UPI0020088F4F|nr:uncharacterized protein B0H18DRAFT_1125731 [Neoantrodia serialis]KAH9914255.1 hypothetical protein B0H18DRAFT_1125731 [Neoantrodia serialis]